MEHFGGVDWVGQKYETFLCFHQTNALFQKAMSRKHVQRVKLCTFQDTKEREEQKKNFDYRYIYFLSYYIFVLDL